MNFLKKMFGNKADPFSDAIEGKLRAMDIHNVRGVGGVYELDSAKISEPLFKPFTKATVILADTSAATAIPMMAGQKADGTLEIVSLANYARPNDIREMDRFDARRMAHQGRLRLQSFGTETSPQFKRVLNP